MMLYWIDEKQSPNYPDEWEGIAGAVVFVDGEYNHWEALYIPKHPGG